MLPLSSLALVLASFTPLSPGAQLALYAVFTVVVGGSTLWANIRAGRRKPTVDVDLVKLAASIEHLQKTVDTLATTAERHASHASEIAGLKRELDDLRKLREADAASHRGWGAKTTREIFDRIEAVEKSVAANFQSVERALGRIEGQLSARP